MINITFRGIFKEDEVSWIVAFMYKKYRANPKNWATADRLPPGMRMLMIQFKKDTA